LSGREGFGVLLPLTELARWDSAVFIEMKHLFSITPKDGKGGKVMEGFLTIF
jgi:hypothetical protein